MNFQNLQITITIFSIVLSLGQYNQNKKPTPYKSLCVMWVTEFQIFGKTLAYFAETPGLTNWVHYVIVLFPCRLFLDRISSHHKLNTFFTTITKVFRNNALTNPYCFHHTCGVAKDRRTKHVWKMIKSLNEHTWLRHALSCN